MPTNSARSLGIWVEISDFKSSELESDPLTEELSDPLLQFR